MNPAAPVARLSENSTAPESTALTPNPAGAGADSEADQVADTRRPDRAGPKADLPVNSRTSGPAKATATATAEPSPTAQSRAELPAGAENRADSGSAPRNHGQPQAELGLGPPAGPGPNAGSKAQAAATAAAKAQHKALIQLFAEDFQAQHGQKYLFQHAKDGTAVKRLIGLGLGLEAIRKVWIFAWETLALRPQDWDAKHALSLAGLAARWNELSAAMGAGHKAQRGPVDRNAGTLNDPNDYKNLDFSADSAAARLSEEVAARSDAQRGDQDDQGQPF